MRKSGWIIIFTLAVGLGIGAAVISHFVEWVLVDHRSGFSKEARQNRFLAGELLLRSLQYSARTLEDRHAFATQPSGSTVLLDSDGAFADPKLRAELLAWVRRGGHLVLPLDSTHDERLLEALGINMEGHLDLSPDYYEVPLENQRLRVKLPAAPVFSLDEAPQWSIDLIGRFEDTTQNKRRGKPIRGQIFHADPAPGPELASPVYTPADKKNKPAADGATHSRPAEGHTSGEDADAQAEDSTEGATDDDTTADPDLTSIYARYPLGQGVVTVGDFSPLTNAGIEELDHAALFVRLLTLPHDRRPVGILIAPKYPGLFEWLFGHAGEAWFAAAILLAAGLWRTMPRFGPLLPEAPPVRPGLGEHLAACGHFLLQRRAYEYLIGPLREDVLRALEAQRHRHPEISDRIALAAHLSGMRPADIDRALAPEPDTHHEFLRRVQTLAALRTLCRRLRKHSSVSGALS